MALLFMDGFDAGDFAQKWTSSVGCVSSVGGRYGSGRHLYMNGGGQYIMKTFTASSQVTIGFAFQSDSTSPNTILTIYGDNGLTTHLSLIWGVTVLNLYRGAAGTLLASGNVAPPVGTWSYVEVQSTIADAGGTCVVKVDGTTVINFTGDTKNAGTATTIDYIQLARNGANVHFDDLYILNGTGVAPYNTFLGDIRINTLIPSGAGSDTGFTPSAGANYTAVDELPYSATDYVSATASGTRDLYAMGDVTGSYNVLAVQNNVIAKKTDAGGTAIKPALKSAGTVYYGSNSTLTANDVTITDPRTADPATGVAWTQGGVNALEAGMEIV